MAPFFVPDQSEPAQRRFVFGYRVTIENGSTEPIQILGRRCVIGAAHGRARPAAPPRAAPDHPRPDPGDSYTYSSWCPLETPWGTMQGEFKALARGSLPRSLQIARFYLVAGQAALSHNPRPRRFSAIFYAAR